MSGQPWGRTGRVTLNPLYQGVLTEVYVDDELVGHVYDDDLYAWDCHRWKFSPPMPTADHALWWLLRRAAPKVWLKERPVVYSVARAGARWWVWSDQVGPKEDHGDHECIHPITVRTFADAIYVANFNARSLAGITS